MTHSNGADDAAGRVAATGGLIQNYEEIATASRDMLEASRVGDWDRVEQIAVRCNAMIEALKKAAGVADRLSAAELARRMDLLRGILQDDAQIRVRAEPWLLELETFMAGPRPAAKPSP